MALLGLLAEAHPISDRYVGHQLDVTVQQDALLVRYAVELPDALGTADDPGLLREMASGILVVADGRAVPTQRVQEDLRRGSAHTTQVEVILRAMLPRGTSEVALSNGNLPDIPAYYLSRVWVQGVDATSPSQPAATWTRGERQRRIQLTLSRREDVPARVWRLLAPAPQARRPLAQAGPSSWSAPLHEPRGSPESALVALGAVLALGSGRREPSRTASAALLLGAVALGALLGAPARPFLGALGAVAIVTSWVLRPEWLAATCLAAMASAQPTPFALCCAAGALCAPAAVRAQRLVSPIAVGVAVVLLARALP